jgi:hypothetical protein
VIRSCQFAGVRMLSFYGRRITVLSCAVMLRCDCDLMIIHALQLASVALRAVGIGCHGCTIPTHHAAPLLLLLFLSFCQS